jgi:dynein heavy chain 1
VVLWLVGFQEISFWLNLERALLRIQEKRESVEVALTLDILKHGKRFHATVRYHTLLIHHWPST